MNNFPIVVSEDYFDDITLARYIGVFIQHDIRYHKVDDYSFQTIHEYKDGLKISLCWKAIRPLNTIGLRTNYAPNLIQYAEKSILKVYDKKILSYSKYDYSDIPDKISNKFYLLFDENYKDNYHWLEYNVYIPCQIPDSFFSDLLHCTTCFIEFENYLNNLEKRSK